MNFFEQQREKLGLNATQMAARIGTTAPAVLHWEQDARVPSVPIAALAVAYEVSEAVMERQVMALRRRREAAAPAAAK